MQLNPIIIGIVGTSGAGKTTIASYLNKKGFYPVTLSKYIRKEAEKLGCKKIDKRTLQDVGNKMRETHGSNILARLALEELRKKKAKKAIIDGIRNILELSFLEKEKKFFLIGVEADLKTRYQRVSERESVGFINLKSFKQIEERENNLGAEKTGLRVAECVKRAFMVINNNGSIKELYSQVDKLVRDIETLKKRRFNLIILGPPGAGKTTQGKFLSERLHIPWLSMGELLRDAYKKGRPEGKLWWEKYGSKGYNAPISLKFGLLIKHLVVLRDGFILDDFPRTKEDLKSLQNYLLWSKEKIDKAILIDVSENTSIRRIAKRWQKGLKRGVARCDDGPDILKVRIKEGYKKELPAILAYFKRKKILKKIDGNGRKSVNEVYEEIFKAITEK